RRRRGRADGRQARGRPRPLHRRPEIDPRPVPPRGELMSTLTPDEQDMVRLVAEFVDARVRPNVRKYEADDVYPEEFIEEMKKLGFFGLLVPAEHGGVDVSTACFARVTEELARGW